MWAYGIVAFAISSNRSCAPISVFVCKTETIMGTYTTNYNLFMPTIGEQGWGDLVNGNFETIDTSMKGLDTRMGTADSNITSLTTRMGTAETIITSNTSRIGTLETETDALEKRVTVLENTIPEQGLVEGNLKGLLFVPAVIQTFEGDEIYATCAAQSTNTGTSTVGNAVTLTVKNYERSFTFPIQHTYGVYTQESDIISGNISPSLITRTLTVNIPWTGTTWTFYYKKSTDSSYTSFSVGSNATTKYITLDVGSTYTLYGKYSSNGNYVQGITMSLPEEPKYYIKYQSP